MAKDLKLDKQLADKERKRLEREKAEKKEKFRESFGKKLGGAVSKVMQPVKGIFDKILETIMSILLYAGLMRFLDWFSDPDNQKKIKNLFRFLGKFWPALLALYLAFGNGFTKALLRMTGSLLKFIPKLVMIAAKLAFKAGKALLGAVMKNPLAAAGALVVGGTAIATIKANQDDTAVIKDAKNPKKSHMDEINEFGGMTGSPMGGLFSSGGLVPDLSTTEQPEHGTGGIVKGFSGGGPVPKSTSNSKNGGKNFPPKNRPVSLLSSGGLVKHGTGDIVRGFSGGGSVPKSTSNSKNEGKNFPPKNRPVSFLSGGGKVSRTNSTTNYLSGGGRVVNYGSGDQVSTLNPTFNLHMSSGGSVSNVTEYLSGGGKVYSVTNYLSGGGEPMGTDTVPAMLTPGEFVMSRGAVQKYGVKTLEEMNASGGGTNRPKLVRGVSYAQGGGGVKRNQKERPSQNTSQEQDTDKGTDTKLEGTGGGPAVINAGKQILAKGYTVAEHPNFRKNSYSGTGANTGVGFNPSGGERVGGHSSKSLHYSNLAIDVTDWRPGDWLGRTSALAESIYQNKEALKVTQIIHDPWGSWFAGESGKGPGIGGHGTHLHIGFAGGDTAGSIGDPANSGSGTTPGSTAPGSTSPSGGSTSPSSASSSGASSGVSKLTGYRKDPAATLSPEQSRYSVNPLKRGSGMSSRGDKNAAELSQTAPSELSTSDAAILASGKPAAPTTQAASPGRGTQSRRRSAEDPNNMILFSNRALHNIIL